MKLQLLSFLFLIQTGFLLCQTSVDQLDLEMGMYNVGFKHYTAIDSTRTYTRRPGINNITEPRPIPISIWYPSVNDSSQAMTVLNYMEVLKEEEEWEHLPNSFILDWFYYQNTPENQKHLSEKVKASQDEALLNGKFPVILYAASFEASSVENFALSEMLASQGYIVISSPSQGTESKRFKKPERAIETQARDIEFLIKEVARIPQADMNKVGTMGFSFGGLSNVLAQLRNQIIKANVSLDGTIRYNPKLLKSTAFYDPKKAITPFIHMAQKIIPDSILKSDKIDPKLNTDFEYYDTLTECDAYKMRFHDLSHSYFSTMGVLFNKRDTRQDKSYRAIMQSYKLVTQYTLQFLNAYLKEDEKALQFLNNKPAENNISAGLISITSKKTNTIEKADYYNFKIAAQKQAYKNLPALYKQMKATHPELEIPEGKLNTLGLQLVFNPELQSAGINIFKLAVLLYPNSANLYDSLAEGYLHIGDTKNAVVAFKKSLALNPGNTNATKRLKELKQD